MGKLRYFFTPKDNFLEDEWILKYKVKALLIISFSVGIGIIIFGFYRLYHEYIIVGASQIFFGIFLLVGFVILRNKKRYYTTLAMIFFILAFMLLMLIFFYVPQNSARILWMVALLVFVFFLLDKRGGMFFLFLFLFFLAYLILIDYPYSIIEFITFFSTILTTSLILFAYEKVKTREKERLLSFNEILQKEINKQTKELNILNTKLEVRVKEELSKRLEQEQMLLRQCRLASMGEMIDSIAHQWRQPLMNINAILMNIDRAVHMKKDEAYIEDKVDEVASLTSHMSQTIEDFRNLFKVKKEMVTFHLEDTLDEVMTLMKNSLKDIEVTFEKESNISIKSYKNELIQVIISILNNAIEALNQRDINPKKITISLKKDKEFIVINIEDNAGGIPTQEIDKIFDPYFSTKKQSGGTGLGLYIAQIIIEHNIKGHIDAKNSENGAIFNIQLRREIDEINT